MISAFLKAVLEGTLSLLFPPRCEVCGLLQEPLICESCRGTFRAISAPFCERCGIPFDPLAHTLAECAACRQTPPAFDAARSAGMYGGELRRAIHLFKYDGVRALAAPLAAFIADTIPPPGEFDCLCPVPLHPARERMRGYNQSGLLAEELGRSCACRSSQLCSRAFSIPPRRCNSQPKRASAMCAALLPRPLTHSVRNIGLIDDVYTTGSTLLECSRILKRAGARHVTVITIARA